MNKENHSNRRMDTKSQEMLKSLSPKKIFLPMVVGLGAIIYLMATDEKMDFDKVIEAFKNINIWWVVAAFLVLFVRDAGYMYRIRHLTSEALDWSSSFFVILLWEFASAITPSVVGGTAVAVFIINQEKVAFGKSLAYVMLTAVLDNLFFVLASFAVIFLAKGDIFPDDAKSLVIMGYELNLEQIFLVSVGLIAVYTVLMSWGLFFGPHSFKRLLAKITSNKLLRRWRRSAIRSGNEMIIASKELKGHTAGYWVKAIVSTIFIWSARYLMLNCIINAFLHVNLFDMSFDEVYTQFLIFARQIIMWIVMLISPTPGSSGTAEYFFGEFFEEFLGAGLVLAVALLWRLFTYYAYLVVGVFVIPRWITRIFKRRQTVKTR
ncbi:lysylphosphatidylglycerol synthase transmembrane domain-containing protein [Limibacter armeniacum]|uniref:lysylphosphatidylglycerol synthase transmembrane domain-containing protein n=1 Tax=Limibacter armeniacum TaxID=466084 RepID=UPI002FE678C0